MLSSKRAAFETLCRDAEACDKCASMKGKTRVLSKLNGPIDSKILFIAEAPGRLGADVYRIPLHGDITGNNFELLLPFAGLSRKDIFITNCVICNPRDNEGKNRKPSKEELRSCLPFLLSIINISNPAIIVTLGAIALRMINGIFSTNHVLKAEDVKPLKLTNGKHLFPLFHPSPLAMVHRPKQLQISDYSRLGDFIHART